MCSTRTILILGMLLIWSIGCTGGVNETVPPPTTIQATDAPQTTQPPTVMETVKDILKKSPQYIGNFQAFEDNRLIELRFSLMDDNREYVQANGHGAIKIVNTEDEIVYMDTIDVIKEDFGEYTLLLTGEPLSAYVWEIPTSKLNKSISPEGTVFLKFKTNDGSEFEEIDTSIYGLPIYTEEELFQINEEVYSKNAISVNKEISKGSFRVVVKSAGYFSPLVTYGEKEEYLRVDMEVKNIGSKKEYFSPDALALLDNKGNQYEEEYGGTLKMYGEIYSGITKRGYILFSDLPKYTQSVRLVFELGHDADYNPYSFEYTIPLTVQH